MVPSGARRRPVCRFERFLRGLLFPAAVFLTFLAFEAAFRSWAMGWSRLRPAGRARRFNLLVQWCGAVLTELTRILLRVRIEVHGHVPPGRFIVVANHQSAADIAYLIWALRPLNCKFIAKESLRRWLPAVSTYLKHAGAATISREGSRRDLRGLAGMALGLAPWTGSAVVFPEGRRSRDGRVGSYKSAVVRVLVRTSGLPLLPACIAGAHEAVEIGDLGRGLFDRDVIVTVGDAISVPAAEVRAALDGIHAWTVATVDAARDRTVGRTCG